LLYQVLQLPVITAFVQNERGGSLGVLDLLQVKFGQLPVSEERQAILAFQFDNDQVGVLIRFLRQNCIDGIAEAQLTRSAYFVLHGASFALGNPVLLPTPIWSAARDCRFGIFGFRAEGTKTKIPKRQSLTALQNRPYAMIARMALP
jgi:hypothetical protein